jgi:hypothetical protein
VVFVVAVLMLNPGQSEASQASLVFGGVHARYGDSLAGTAGVVGGRFAGTSGLMVGVLDASVSQFASGGWASQISGGGSTYSRIGRTGMWGVTAAANLSDFQSGSWVGTATAGPSLHVGSENIVGSFTVALGRMRDTGQNLLNLRTASGGFRFRIHPDITWSLSAARWAADSVRFWDTGGALVFDGRPLMLTLSG